MKKTQISGKVSIPCSWIRRINTDKIFVLPQTNYTLNTIPIKIPIVLFTETEKNNAKIPVEPHKTLNSESNPEKKE